MRQTGVTIPELLGVLAITAILLTVALPGMASLGRSSALASSANEFLASLHLARSEAVKRGARTAVCASANGQSCAGGGGWHQGWLVFHDANNNAARDEGEALIQARPALPAGIRLTGNPNVSSYISYAPNGGTKLVGGAFQAGTLTVCREAEVPASARRLVISSTGRVRTVKLELAACP